MALAPRGSLWLHSPIMSTAKSIIESLGGVAETARKLGVRHPSVCKWLARGVIPVDRVRAVSAATGLPHHAIRPDLFDPPQSAAVQPAA